MSLLGGTAVIQNPFKPKRYCYNFIGSLQTRLFERAAAFTLCSDWSTAAPFLAATAGSYARKADHASSLFQPFITNARGAISNPHFKGLELL